MIRAIAIVSLLAMLVLVLYVPSVHAPSEILRTLRQEHAANARLRGLAHADQQLERAMRLQSDAAQSSPLPSAHPTARSPGINGAIAEEMISVNRRLFDNAYVRSVDAVLLLASYRLVGLLAWLPWLAPLALAAALDGGWVRIIKAREFGHHDPELFAVWCCLLILVGCGSVVGLVVPVVVHPLVWAGAIVAVAALVGLGVGSFHRRA